VLGLGGAAALVLFGARVLALGHRAGPGLLLGMFALFWGLQIALVRLWAADPPAGRFYLLASLPFLLPLYLLLTHFAAVFPRRMRVATSPAWPLLLVVPAAVWFALVALQPEAGLRRVAAGSIPWGWATFVFLTPPLVGSMLFALARFSLEAVRAPVGPTRRQFELCALALLVYLAYWLPQLTALTPVYWPVAVAQYGLPAAVAYHATLAAGLVGVATVAAFLVARSPAPARLRWATAAVVPALVALPTSQADPSGGVLGVVRMFSVALLAYAVAKHSLLGVDLRLRATAPWAVTVGVGLTAWGLLATAAASLLGARWPDQPMPFLATAAVGASAAVAARPHVARFFEAAFPYIRATEEYRLRRKIEVYRAALDAGTDASGLDALAADLGLSGRERLLVARALDAPDAPTGMEGTVPARYLLEQRLAEGAFGGVWAARDRRLGERVVVKQYRGFVGRDAAESFAREAKVMGELRSADIVEVKDVYRDGDDAYVVMEHADGGSLEARLAAGWRPSLQEAADVAASVLRALDAAHRRGVVHRDVKPGNVLFVGGRAKLADFGIALDPTLEGALRAARGGWGTVPWMAPEQARGEGATAASDVHAVGALLYRMLAGCPWVDVEGLGEQAARRAVATRTPVLPLGGVPPNLNDVLQRALSKSPGDRYPDAGGMLKDLERRQRAAARGVLPTRRLMPGGSDTPA
jgi:protein kinase-like protein